MTCLLWSCFSPAAHNPSAGPLVYHPMPFPHSFADRREPRIVYRHETRYLVAMRTWWALRLEYGFTWVVFRWLVIERDIWHPYFHIYLFPCISWLLGQQLSSISISSNHIRSHCLPSEVKKRTMLEAAERELGVGLSGRSAYIKPFITVTLSQNHLSEANI